MATLTPNYSFYLPAVNDPVDANIWGNELNTNFSNLDVDLKAISDAADEAVANGPEPGDICWSWRTSKSGWVIGQGTIGNTASAATNRANDDTLLLYTELWNNLADAQASVSGGRGVDAATDFAANKTITVPDGRGRALVGRDNMGGTTASRITVAVSNIIGTVLGAFGGDQNVHAHSHANTLNDPGHGHNQNDNPGAGANPAVNRISTTGSPVNTGIATNTTGITITNAVFGTGVSQNVQPTLIANMFYKL